MARCRRLTRMPSWDMLCPSCERRRARRDCPALNSTICTVCCGTKRQVEIACPSHCVYLTAAREHPAAVVRRRQEHDVAELLPTIRHLTERQYQLFFLVHSVIARFRPAGLSRLVDSDVAEAAAAVAATLETSARGVIYQHTPPGLPAQALATELTSTLAQIREQGATIYDHEAGVVLRAIEKGARPAQRLVDPGIDGTRYLDLLARLLQSSGQAEPDPPPSPEHGLILP